MHEKNQKIFYSVISQMEYRMSAMKKKANKEFSNGYHTHRHTRTCVPLIKRCE